MGGGILHTRMNTYILHIFLLSVILLEFSLSDSNTQKSDDLRYKHIRSELIAGSELNIVGAEYIHLVIIITNVGVGDLVLGILLVFRNLLSSLLFSSKGTPIHLILITDDQSKSKVETAIAHSIGKYLSETVIKWELTEVQERAFIVPTIYTEFVNINSITQPNREAIDVMKELYSLNKAESDIKKLENNITIVLSPKYSQD